MGYIAMTIYRVFSHDDRTFGLDPFGEVESLNTGAFIGPEFNLDSNARLSVLDKWEELSFRPRMHRGKPNIRGLKDVHPSIWQGFSHFVSSRAKAVLEEAFPGQALYFPIHVEGVGSDSYWALWILSVVDAIDAEASQFTPIVPGKLHRLSKRVYRCDLLKDLGMFRLPMVYGEPDHFAESFKQVVGAAELTNFEFCRLG
jgi:hypothetical protein